MFRLVHSMFASPPCAPNGPSDNGDASTAIPEHVTETISADATEDSPKLLDISKERTTLRLVGDGRCLSGECTKHGQKWLDRVSSASDITEELLDEMFDEKWTQYLQSHQE